MGHAEAGVISERGVVVIQRGIGGGNDLHTAILHENSRNSKAGLPRHRTIAYKTERAGTGACCLYLAAQAALA